MGTGASSLEPQGIEGTDQYNNEFVDMSKSKLHTKEFKVEGLTRPFYLYSFAIYKAKARDQEPKPNGQNKDGKQQDWRAPRPDSNKISRRIREKVLEKTIQDWLNENKPDSELYLQDQVTGRLYTQFDIATSSSGSNSFTIGKSPIGLNKKEGSPDRINRSSKNVNEVKNNNDNRCLRQQVTVEVPRLIYSKYELVEETYDIVITMIGQPVKELSSSQHCLSEDVLWAINSLLLADVKRNKAFDVKLSRQNIGRVFRLDDEQHRRIARVDSCLMACRGLATCIGQVHDGVNEAPSLNFKLIEELGYYFRPVNMIELLEGHFKFDVHRPLEPEQIELLRRELHNEAVEMRPERLGDVEEGLPEYYVSSVGDISQKPIREELCHLQDEKTGQILGRATVEEQFKHEFPNFELQFREMPCLISAAGRWMPMEVCWIKQGEMGKNKLYTFDQMGGTLWSYRELREIFDENCNDFFKNQMITFKRFGLQIMPISNKQRNS